MTVLVPLLGDQLSPALPSLAAARKGHDVLLFVEVAAEAGYVNHHKKKIAYLFSAMRHWARALEEQGHRVDYVRLDAPGNTHSFKGEVARAVARHGATCVVVTEPGEWRVKADMDTWAQACGVPVQVLPDTRFLCSTERFTAWAQGRKTLRMEFFYREMRKAYGLLLTPGGDPEGGAWNFDADNRKPLPKGVVPPAPLSFPPDALTAEVLALCRTRFADHFGDLDPFDLAVTHADAQRVLDEFLAKRLAFFGDYQDAMKMGEDYLYHSRLSTYLNSGLLDPLPVCRAAEAAYRAGTVPLNAAEGFIRQILGWREYVRGIYWLKMPDYAGLNHFGNTRPLPDFYWTGDTDMTCLRETVAATRRNGYAHHIQRLMVTGNFALLAGVRPADLCDWYLAVYTDAYDWVELPNTLGMVLHADGGYLGSKPYAASGKYIDRMSDYCANCRYNVAEATGDNACPFNALYWDFLQRHEAQLRTNPRMAVIYKTLDKMAPEKKVALRERAQGFLDSLPSGGY
jgi:deoxyribodipyrimidine photolyase-related protein